jgi:tRNA modification GTPase
MKTGDIIAAVATPPGRGGIGIIRISGPQLSTIVDGVVARALPPRRAVHAEFRGDDGAAIDQGIALFFPAPHSYTGEDVLELHGHGGPVVLRMLLERCLALGARIAEPGEFTRRAYLNAKLDLAQAEAVVDLIEASTAQAARCALRSLSGEFSDEIQTLISELVELRALVEATLDFPEEEIDFLKQSHAAARLDRTRNQIERVISAAQRGRLLREGIQIVLAGQPNVGKSSLLNRLAGEDLAIVTDMPGTTRDSIRQAIDVGGIPAHIIDTAGLRDSRDPVETLGIRRTWMAIEKADLVLLLIDATEGESAADRAILAQLPSGLKCVRVMNKIDLIPRSAGVDAATSITVWVSAKTGEGIELLRNVLLESVGGQSTIEGVFLARARHLQALNDARRHLCEAAEHAGHLELFAEALRQAQGALAAIAGEFTPDDLLGEIFSRFCIGK